MLFGLFKSKAKQQPAAPEKVERPAETDNDVLPAVCTSILGPGSGFYKCLLALVGDGAGLTVLRQTARVGAGSADRYEVSFWAGGMRQVVRGTSQVDVALTIADLLEELRDAPAYTAFQNAFRERE